MMLYLGRCLRTRFASSISASSSLSVTTYSRSRIWRTSASVFGSRGRDSWKYERTRLRSRSEEHTSELQSPCNLVCRLLLEKKKISLEYSNRFAHTHAD